MAMISDHFGLGGTAGIGFVFAWDHTKSFNDSSAWSRGKMIWLAAGASGASGRGGSLMADFGLSNATHVSQLNGQFVEGGGSVNTPFYGLTMGGTLSRGVNPDGSWNDIWLGTYSVGGATKGWEVHGFIGNAWVTEYDY